MDLALIGNCNYQAIIDNSAQVRWLCWPRFDSSFVFGSLIADDNGGTFAITPTTKSTSQQAYLPHTNVLRTQFDCADGSFEVTDCAPRFFQNERSFKPRMLIRRITPLVDWPRITITCQPVYDYGLATAKPRVGSHHLEWSFDEQPIRLTTNAPLTHLQNASPAVLREPLYLVLTWGQPLETYLEETCERFIRKTTQYWQQWVKHCVLPETFQSEVIRSALTLKLHQYEDTGAITAATTTSLPEHDKGGRNWDYRYCWLRDAVFTLGALRRLGHFEEVERFITFFHNVARDDQPIQPLYGIGGETALEERELSHLSGYLGNQPVRVGNAAYSQLQHDVYGETLAVLAPLYTDARFEQNSTKTIHKLLSEIENTLEIPDAGLWEKRDTPRVHTFSLLMHWVGARAAAMVGRASDDSALVTRAAQVTLRATELIDSAWREDRGYFADAVDSDEADAALMMMVNVGFLSHEDPRALSHVRETASSLKVGTGLLKRYKHDDGLGETNNTFTACGFWYAEALARLGQQDDALRAYEHLLSLANPLGLFSEDIDPHTNTQWGNFPQTYSHVGVINTAFALSPPFEPLI